MSLLAPCPTAWDLLFVLTGALAASIWGVLLVNPATATTPLVVIFFLALLHVMSCTTSTSSTSVPAEQRGCFPRTVLGDGTMFVAPDNAWPLPTFTMSRLISVRYSADPQVWLLLSTG
ncbi:hypothetical protein BC826DRAFT_1075817 [Russula brevipes]|nr:hypothetical protein BC826DRAFT_1075817 [Russula brevipes]